jgi:hypothetical protein
MEPIHKASFTDFLRVAGTKQVFLGPLIRAQPPIIPADRIESFVREVFWNLDAILNHHQSLLASLFERQRDQHPIVQSVSDVILAAALAFTDDYEIYIKVCSALLVVTMVTQSSGSTIHWQRLDIGGKCAEILHTKNFYQRAHQTSGQKNETSLRSYHAQ